MRKITQLAVDAFLSATPFKQSNTEVVVDESSSDLLLHGRMIATKYHDSNDLYITTTGFQTNVTKERLNGIPGVSIVQKNFQWFLNDVLWDGRAVEINHSSWEYL